MRRRSWARRYLATDRRDTGWLLVGVGGGIALALLAKAYLMAVTLIPSVAEIIRTSEQQMQSVPNLGAAYAVMAIAFAPLPRSICFAALSSGRSTGTGAVGGPSLRQRRSLRSITRPSHGFRWHWSAQRIACCSRNRADWHRRYCCT